MSEAYIGGDLIDEACIAGELRDIHYQQQQQQLRDIYYQGIDALAQAIHNFDGGVILVSHDFRLISQVAKEIWVCDNLSVTPWTKHVANMKSLNTIQSYKEYLKNSVLKKKRLATTA